MRIPAMGWLGLAALIVFSGIGLGALLAVVTHGNAVRTTQTALAPAVAPPVSAPTSRPTLVPTAAHTAVPTASPTPVQTPVAARRAAGEWRFDEANVAVGSIVWVGRAVVQQDEMIFDLHKQSVAGRPAVPCERETELRIVLRRNHAPDTVPYHEVNCEGQAQDGQVRISALPSNGSFSGSFWDGATKLGDFAASSQ